MLQETLITKVEIKRVGNFISANFLMTKPNSSNEVLLLKQYGKAHVRQSRIWNISQGATPAPPLKG